MSLSPTQEAISAHFDNGVCNAKHMLPITNDDSIGPRLKRLQREPAFIVSLYGNNKLMGFVIGKHCNADLGHWTLFYICSHTLNIRADFDGVVHLVLVSVGRAIASADGKS